MGRAHGQDGRCSSSGKKLQEHDALSRKGMHPYREDCTMSNLILESLSGKWKTMIDAERKEIK